MKKIGVVTVGRSDYGIYLPVLRGIDEHPSLDLRLYVTGMHLAPEFGYTAQAIVDDGFEIHERVEMLVASDTPEAVAKSIGLGTVGFAQVFGRDRPDMLVVLGDRFEMYASALAALPFRIPIAHIHGGELTQGAIDDVMRHSLTKLSHLHFVATETYARRVAQLGEEPWRISVSGAPGLDNLRAVELLDARGIEAAYGVALPEPPLLVTFHPVTLEPDEIEWHVGELLAALSATDKPLVFTLPNADTGGRVVRREITRFVAETPRAFLVENLGTQGYFSLMAVAGAMVGNSSSGIVEAASFGLPVVNVGTRQQGRFKGRNILDVGYGRGEILNGIGRAVDPAFRKDMEGMDNPYGAGNAAGVIVDRLADAPSAAELLNKRFHDLDGSAGLA